MPLPAAAARRELHHRVVDMRAFERDDGLFDVEARLVDRKPFEYVRPGSGRRLPAGQPLHDLWVRLTLDADFVVQAIDAASDATPWAVCGEAGAALQSLRGERVARGWTAVVRERLRGAAGCTHMMEVLIAMGTTALQGIRGADPQRTLRAEEKIDSCYAYGRTREVVKFLWPAHHRPADGA